MRAVYSDNSVGGNDRGVEQREAHLAHNQEVAGSTPAPAIWARRALVSYEGERVAAEAAMFVSIKLFSITTYVFVSTFTTQV